MSMDNTKVISPPKTEILNSEILKIETNLEKFKNSDMIDSFYSGVMWGIIVLCFLSVCAWLVSVMRQRVVVNRNLTTPKNTVVVEENNNNST